MVRVKMKDLVRLPTGEVIELGKLLDEGRACVSKTEKFGSRVTESGLTTKYFVDLLPPLNGSWEIGQKAYESRKQKCK